MVVMWEINSSLTRQLLLFLLTDGGAEDCILTTRDCVLCSLVKSFKKHELSIASLQSNF